MYAASSSAADRIHAGFRCLLPTFAAMLLGACALSPATPSAPGALPAEAALAAAIRTEHGELVLSFDAAAAPQAVAALRRAFEQHGFDGTRIAWVRPHTEIRTQVPAGAPTSLASELDARALGLDVQRIEDPGAAMNAIQFELEPAFLRAGNQASPQLRAWIATWRADFDPGFLVGTTRQQINEALGHRYQDGHASRPLRRGSVALVPAGPNSTTLAMAILLRDQPERDGRWVVVGQVESGIEVVEAITLLPRLHPKSNQLKQPVRIVSADVTEVLPARGKSP